MPIIQKTIETGYSAIQHLPLVDKVLANKYASNISRYLLTFRYISAGIQLAVSYGKSAVTYVDCKIDTVIEKAVSVKDTAVETTLSSKNLLSEYVAGLINRYNQEKFEVISKAKGYKSAISEQITVLSDSAPVNGLKVKVAESVRQAPDMMRSLSNKAVSLTKQGLEISIGQEKTETVLNTVKTHTPKFVSSLLAMEPTFGVASEIPQAVTIPSEPVAASVAAH